MNKKDLKLFVLWKFFGFLIFLGVIFIFNIATNFIRDPIFSEIIKLVNQNIITILLISFFFILGELFNSTGRKYKYFGPIFNGLSALFLAYFIVEVILFLGRLVEGSFFVLVGKYHIWIYLVSFILVTGLDYFKIFHKKKK